MNKLHITVAAALALGSQLAFAQQQVAVPFEGGQAANSFALAPPPLNSAARVRTVVSIDSRSGQQSDVEKAQNQPFTGSRSREAVRAEAGTVVRELSAQVFEGGQVGYSPGRRITPPLGAFAVRPG